MATRLLVTGGAGWDKVEHVPDRKGHERRYSVDAGRIRRELGHVPATGLSTGLEATVAWYRDNRAWWEPLRADRVPQNA
ncbi:hypothetical protein [Streptomyces fimbriatus]|uniref:dTDP-glucose 4,6-dehydratase n=1 Tax=Streptomyces fimbriatus TaxID=68197 RepID=A0ABW0DCW4_STRFI